MGLLIFWIILFVIILLHELGHLLMAKKYGVRVHTYSIGFGPKLIGIKIWKGSLTKKYYIAYQIFNFKPHNPEIWKMEKLTEYRLSPILLGGFCHLAGELKDTGKSYELNSKPFMQKLKIALAGVITNFVTGALMIIGIGIKNLGFINGISRAFVLIGKAIIIPFTAIYLLCTGGATMTTASETNQLMSNVSLEHGLILFGVFSIAMAIINTLPFPALDGSLPMLWGLEKLFGKRASKLLKIIWLTGFAVLMILQVVILYFWIWG